MNGIRDQKKSESVLSVSQLIGIEKRCARCKKIKDIEDFYKSKNTKDGHVYLCKICDTERIQKWKDNNYDKVREIDRRWKANNIELIRKKGRAWRRKNRDIACERTRKWQKENPEKVKKWAKENPEKYKSIQIKYKKSVKGKLNRSISVGVWRSLNGQKNGRGWENLVGYTLDDFKKDIGLKFTEGMSWGNYGQWHIDHIIPISAFNFEKPEDIDFKRCWSLENLRPLWAIDNLKKHSKIDAPFQPSFIF